ncbi:DNA helicase Pif1-like [Trypanosoma melophagium]|uniref:DNA helicase Pif1-like n=1 Tax=Trypanosoma melophagium TaxID=715481 RepID=UPI003519DA92|nr:DNA helicase Pif1-like [Trypanosoma melophagium]
MSSSKPKLTVSAVRGRIIVAAEDGERIGGWGGTECFLSRQTGLGPCLVVRSSRHKRHEGTFFQLNSLQRVLSAYAVEGKLTVVVPHERRLCTVFIETTTDIDALRVMAAVLQDRNHWKDMEKNVACKKGRNTRSTVKTMEITSRKGGGGNVDGSLRDLSLNDEGEDWDYNEDSAEKTDNEEEKEEVASHLKTSLSTVAREDLTTLITGDKPSSSATVVATAKTETVSLIETREGISRITWTQEQMRATHLVRSGQSVFVTGAVGTGKTTWLRYIIDSILSRNGETVISASTAISAHDLNGCTIHALAGIERGACTIEKALHHVKSQPDILRVWRKCKTLIINDVEMLSGDVFTLIDTIARRVRNIPDKPFGGIRLILLGDFFKSSFLIHSTQTVIATDTEDDNRHHERRMWCFETTVWKALHLVAVEFCANYRYVDDMIFAAVLADIRRGLYTRRVQRVISTWFNRPRTMRYGVEPTRIVADVHIAEAHNQRRLNLLMQQKQKEFELGGEEKDNWIQRYKSEDYASTPGENVDAEVVLLPFIELCIGAQVVLLAALPQSPRLLLGDCGTVVAFTAEKNGSVLPVVCFAHSGGEEVVVPRVCVNVFSADGSIRATRTQIPLRLAWALTVWDVRGLTLPLIHLDLNSHNSSNNSNSGLSCAEMYLALTRVRQEEDISLTRFDPSSVFHADTKVLTLYETLFPQRWRCENEKTDSNWDSQLVELGRGEKRTRSPSSPTHRSKSDNNNNNNNNNINDNNNSTDIHWRREGLFDSQLDTPMPLGAAVTVKQDALKLLAAAGSAIPHLTQESDAAEEFSVWQTHTQTSSQRLLLLDDDENE